MNTLHLRYAIAVDRTRSISKAAEELFMGQPNLSRAIKELEKSVGITIFKRTSKGIEPTREGERFLQYAASVVQQIDMLESMYHSQGDGMGKLIFSVSVPRASYISHSFTELVKEYADSDGIEFYFKETNAFRAIKNLFDENFNLGIVRFQDIHEQLFLTYFKEKSLKAIELLSFEYCIVMSVAHELAAQQTIQFEHLNGYIEIAHGDPYVPYLPQAEIKQEVLGGNADKRVFVYERASQFELLSSVPTTYMWVSAIPQCILDRYNLITRKCTGNNKRHKDFLIYRSDYHLTDIDRCFIDKIKQTQSALRLSQ